MPIATGIFGVAVIMGSAGRKAQVQPIASKIGWRSTIPDREDVVRSALPAAEVALSDLASGYLPGAGPTISNIHRLRD